MKLLLITLLLAASPLEDQNAKKVADAEDLCTRSHCRPPSGFRVSCASWSCRGCGRFSYVTTPAGQEVQYELSNCEREYLRDATEKAAVAEDEAIRAKYRKDGGQ